MKEVKSNSQDKEIRVPMTNTKWSKEDEWAKMAHNVNGVEMHYVKNTKTGEFDDFKFKDKK